VGTCAIVGVLFHINITGPRNRDNETGETRLASGRPRDKCLAGTFQPSPAEQIRERVRGVLLPLAGHDKERCQNRLRLPADRVVPAV
jgi:hypothetical protein